MIIYDLVCEKKHKFEGWFNDREAFEAQKSEKLVTCPVCGSSKVNMLPSSVATISGKEKKTPRKRSLQELSPMMALKMFNDYLDKEFDDVGSRFAEVALNIHRGLEEKKNIKGTTTKKEEEILTNEGVHFVKIPVPKFDS